MKSPTLIAFMGPNSQTGTALREEASYIEIPKSDESFDILATRVQNEEILVVIPVWNSHEGEITSSRVIELLMDGKAILHKLWPKRIEFECVSRVGVGKPIRTVISAPVAETQCSAFIKRIKAEFIDGGSTVQAYHRFSKDKTIDAVLCVPGTGKPPFTIVKPDVSNDLNFTTFAVIGNIATRDWIKEWGSLEHLCRPPSCSYAAAELSMFSVASTEDQTLFFQELTSFAQKSLELPRIVFATRRTPDRCGLIIQSEFRKLPENILSDDGYSSEIKITPHIGDGSEKYADRVHAFLESKFPNAVKHPFVKHVGTKPCFFACPAIGVLTHGYDVAVVEPVVRRYIAKWFQLIDDGLECTTLERKFFETYRKAYYESAENFFEFAKV